MPLLPKSSHRPNNPLPAPPFILPYGRPMVRRSGRRIMGLRQYIAIVCVTIVALLTLFRMKDIFKPAVVPQHDVINATDVSYEFAGDQLSSTRVKGASASRSPRYISLIAERHSGSTWMFDVLKHYFRGKDVVVSQAFCTWKHWFQDRIHESIQSGERECQDSQPCPSCLDPNNTLVVALWRNPYDWVSAMSEYPHHAQFHMGLSNNTMAFLTQRWMPDPKVEVVSRETAAKMRSEGVRCMDNFLPMEVIPCNSNDRLKIYELDPQGHAYGNVYELRKAKIADFNAVRRWVPLYELIRYEDILRHGNLREWLLSLEKKYGLVGNHEALPSLKAENSMEKKLLEMYYTNRENCSPSCKFASSSQNRALQILNSFWDYELEGSIGYKKIE